MRLQLDQFGKIKNIVHISQAAVLFLAWVLTIALFTRDGKTDGRVGWYFGLCWLTIPILVYLVMVPMWSRARRFSNVYAFASLDGLSVLLWLTAWASVASYVTSGKGKGDKKDAEGCDNFKYGSPGRCKLSEAIIVFGVIEMLLFGATAFISIRAVMTYKRTGMMPENLPAGRTNEFSAQTQDDFSSSMRNDEEFDAGDDLHHANTTNEFAHRKPSLDDTYAPILQNDHDDLAHMPATHPQSPLGNNGLGIQAYDTSYAGAYGEQHSGAVR